GLAGQFDYYVLSLSWAPTYCQTHADDRAECSGKGFGFVLHGLWPQYDNGGYPENCATQFQLTPDAAAKGQVAGGARPYSYFVGKVVSSGWIYSRCARQESG